MDQFQPPSLPRLFLGLPFKHMHAILTSLEGLVAVGGLVGEVVLKLEAVLVPVTLCAFRLAAGVDRCRSQGISITTHEGEAVKDVTLEDGDGAHEERDGDTGTGTPEHERGAEGAEEPAGSSQDGKLA